MTPREMLAAVSANDARVRSLKCSASVLVADPEPKGTFGAYVRCERPEKLFVLAKKSLGPTLFRLWADGPILCVRVRDELYRGHIERDLPAAGEAGLAGLIHMLRQSLLAPIRLPEGCDVTVLPSRVHEMAFIVVRRNRVMWQTFELERHTLLLARRSICDEAGVEQMAVRYRRYERVAGLWFPTLVEADLAGSKARITLELDDLAINEPIKPRVFQQPTGDGEAAKPLAALLTGVPSP